MPKMAWCVIHQDELIFMSRRRGSYNLGAEYTGDDGIFMEKVIAQEDERLQKAFQDLVAFVIGY